jgi:hypothetical protein
MADRRDRRAPLANRPGGLWAQKDLPGGGQRWLLSDGQVPTLRGLRAKRGPPSTGTWRT